MNWRDRVRADARADLPLQVVHVERAIRAAEQMEGGPYSSGSRETSGRPILPTTSKFASLVVPKTSASLKRCQPPRSFVDERGAEGVGPGDRHVLRAAQVVALVVAPDGRAGFVGVVEDVAAGDLVLAAKGCDRRGAEVVLPGSRAGRRGGEVEHAVAGVRQRLEIQERPAPAGSARFRDHVVDDADFSGSFSMIGLPVRASIRPRKSPLRCAAVGTMRNGRDAPCAA